MCDGILRGHTAPVHFRCCAARGSSASPRLFVNAVERSELHGPLRPLPRARARRRQDRPPRVRHVGDVDEGPPRRRDRDGPRGRAVHPGGDRVPLSGRRDHRRGGGRRRGRAAVAHRPDRRHRELRARAAPLLRVDRLPRARRARARRDLRSLARLAVLGGARRRRLARRRAARGEHLRRRSTRRRSSAAGRRGGRPRRTSTCWRA